MTINKLLAGAAVAALLAGAAQAQVTNSNGGATSAQLPLSGVGYVVSEFQPAAAGDQLAGNIVVDSAFGAAASPFATIPVNGRATLTISLTNATFTTAVGATVAGTAAGGDPCEFETAPIAGGGVGASSVTFISSANNPGISNCSNTAIGTFTIPVLRTSSSAAVDVAMTYTQVNADGSAVASPVVPASTGLSYAVPAAAWDASGVAGDHQFTAGGELLASNAGILSAGTLGTVQVDFRTTGAGGFPIGNPTNGVLIDEPDLFDNVTGTIDITFPNGVGDVNAVAIAGLAGACTGPVADVFSCPVTDADIATFDAGPVNITFGVLGGPTPPVTPEQTPSAVFTTDPDANYVAAGFSGNLAPIAHDDGLREDTVQSGTLAADTYDWVRIGAGGTESNFRIQMASAADAAGISQVRVTIAAGNGLDAQTITIPVGADADTDARIQGSTVTFNSRSMGAHATGSGNANITGIQLQFAEAVLGAGGGAGNAGSDKVIAATSQRQLVNRSPGSFVATPGLGNDG